MSQLYRLLYAHLSSLGCPVFEAGQVPGTASFPYLTFRAELPGDWDGDGSLTLTVWCRSDTPHADRLRLAELLLASVPLSGLPLWLSDGLAVCWRQADGAVEPVESPGASGMQVRHLLKVYPNAK